QAIVGGIVAILVSSGALSASSVWWEVYPAAYISLRAWVFPEIAGTNTFSTWFLVVLAGAVIGYGVYRYFFAYAERTGNLTPSGLYGLFALIVIATIGWVVISSQPEPTEIVFDDETIIVAEAREAGEIGFREEIQISSRPILFSMPERGRFRFEVGTIISPEYIALLLGLVVYTSAFIGEIVRAGIQAVPYGQLEAARAMGLSTSQTLRLVVMPQALRLIIPPLSNQYLNLAKNSSLAIAVAFADTYQVGLTMMNQSGQSVTGFTMILVTYLTMSLVISFVMNIVNSRFQLKTR
ncbi:MAG TPA: ABC transporter permease subunit, partial [Aggregatilineales bacterium]|nr:ABC transporter permease subunit [Aggregatilineales bacterium]